MAGPWKKILDVPLAAGYAQTWRQVLFVESFEVAAGTNLMRMGMMNEASGRYEGIA